MNLASLLFVFCTLIYALGIAFEDIDYHTLLCLLYTMFALFASKNTLGLSGSSTKFSAV